MQSRVLLEVVEGSTQRVGGGPVDGVAFVRAVQGDDINAVALFG